MSNTPTARADPDLIRDLARRARDGNHHAMHQLVEAASPALRATLAARAPVADIDDLMQDTWLKAITALPHLTSLHNPLGWLHTIARNTAIDAARANHRRHSLIDPDGQDRLGEVADRSPGPEQVVVARTGRRYTTLAARAAHLTGRQRAVLVDYLTGHPRTHTAATTHTSTAAVSALLHRARRTLHTGAAS